MDRGEGRQKEGVLLIFAIVLFLTKLFKYFRSLCHLIFFADVKRSSIVFVGV